MSACPCCGAPVEADPLAEALRAVTPTMREIVGFLASRTGRLTSARELAGWVYRDDPNGGPLYDETSIAEVVRYNRPRLRATGWDVFGVRGRGNGYELRAYRSNQPGQSQ
jgi:hypothetical protein